MISATLTRAAQWWHEASSHISAKRCHFFEADLHKYFKYLGTSNLSPTNCIHYLNSCTVHSWNLLLSGWLDYSWVIQEIIEENRKCWGQEKKETKKGNLSVWNIMAEEQWLSGSFSKLCWVGKFCVFWLNSTFQKSLETNKLYIPVTENFILKYIGLYFSGYVCVCLSLLI